MSRYSSPFAQPQRPFHLQRAFTLIEMLVVLVIVGLMATLIVQGFGYSLGLYQRVIKSQRSAYSEVLAYSWLRSSLSTQIPARPKDRGLEGNGVDLTTYTYQPLLAVQGVKTLIRWQLIKDEGDTVLNYHEGNQSFDVYRWPDSAAQFEYITLEGNWIDHWPPEKTGVPALPRALRVQVTSGKESRSYVVVNKIRLRPLVTMDEMLYGR
jgi:general secretion pathway protein J